MSLENSSSSSFFLLFLTARQMSQFSINFFSFSIRLKKKLEFFSSSFFYIFDQPNIFGFSSALSKRPQFKVPRQIFKFRKQLINNYFAHLGNGHQKLGGNFHLVFGDYLTHTMNRNEKVGGVGGRRIVSGFSP